ncbi:putative P-loop containing nucleoside triphosphate hydrolase [Helianthus debilis subsp. tardiflorus]
MAETALDFLIGNLKELLLYNANLISTAKVHVESLYNDLGLLKTSVKAARERAPTPWSKNSSKKSESKSIKPKTLSIRTLPKHSSKKQEAVLQNSLIFADYLSKLRNVGEEIREIRKRVKEIHDNKQFLGNFSNRTEETITRSLPSEEQENVVGFDEEAKRVVGWLNSKTEALGVISIMGMGGLGKTTSTIT